MVCGYEYEPTPYYQEVVDCWKIRVIFSDYDELKFDFSNDKEFAAWEANGPIIASKEIEEILFYDKESAITYISELLYSNTWNVEDSEHYDFRPKQVRKGANNCWIVFDNRYSMLPKARIQLEHHQFLMV